MTPKLTGINEMEALQYLGCRGPDIPPELLSNVKRCAALVMQTVRPRLVYRRFPLIPGTIPDLDGFRPEGEAIQALLRPCSAAVVFAATLGAEFEAMLRRTQIRDMADAVILDACGSAAIENVCDNFCTDLAQAEAPLSLTDRFSPGYGDFPLAQQAEVCRLLNVSRRIGVSLSPDGLMNPQKSVTAIIGISQDSPGIRLRGCAGCAQFETCAYRKDGTNCVSN